ncbi:MAG TPA: sigma-70 family RNA polymerase sigma factor [Gemmataceae bacterium]|nr:sigma-70 family RNA polymerase sigma factor [Gemmataceae bacterium]
MSATRAILAAVRSPEPGDDATDAALLRRFADARDEAAFEAIVRRHARLVWGVCRRVLGHVQDTEDAFQATFLILARDPARSARCGSAAGFLFGVARRIAHKARARAAARTAHSPLPTPAPAPNPATEAALREIQTILDAEIARLPEAYRLPFLLCVVGGRSRAAAAAELRLNPGTLSARLARARLLLRERLAKRGVQLGAAVAVADLVTSACAAPPEVLRAAVAAGVLGRGERAVAALIARPRVQIAALGAAAGLLGSVAVAAGLIAGNLDRPIAPTAVVAEGPAADVPCDPLPAGAVARLGSDRWRHEGEAASMAFSPDGKTLAVLSKNAGAVTFFETATGKVLHRLTAPDGSAAPTLVAFSPDGTVFACQVPNGTVHLWDARTMKRVRSLEPPATLGGLGAPPAIRFSPDGKYLAAIAGDHRLVLWDVARGTPAVGVRWEKLGNPSFACSPDGSLLAVAAIEPVVQLFDTRTGQFVRGFDPDQRFALCLAFSPDGKTIATGGKDLIVLSDVASGKELGRMEMKQVLDVAFTPDGKSLVAVGEDAKARVWDVTSKKERLVLDSRGWIGRSMALSADGKTLAVGTVYNLVQLWDVATGKELTEHPDGHDAPVHTVAFSPDGKLLVTGGANQQLHIWDPATGRQVKQLLGSSASQVSFSPDGRHLATAWQWSKQVRVWDIDCGEVQQALDHPGANEVPCAAFSPDGKTVLSVSWSNTENEKRGKGVLHVWDRASGKVRREAALPGLRFGVLAVSPDGNWAAVGGWAETPLWLCDLTRGRERRLSDGLWDTVKALAFSPDGRVLASGGFDREAVAAGGIHHRPRLWEVATGREIMNLTGHERTVTAVAFAPGGRVLATADGDGAPHTIRFWDVVTGQELARLAGHASNVTSLAFSPDGRRVVAGLNNGTVLVWDTPAGAKLSAMGARKLGPRELAALWADLAGDDARAAYDAVHILAASPGQSVLLLRESLRPAAKIDVKAVRQKIADLENQDFAVREAASRDLAALGEDIEPELRRALAGEPSAEVARRIERLLSAALDTPPPERRRELRAVWALELMGTPGARQVLDGLARGDPDARLTREAKTALGRR